MASSRWQAAARPRARAGARPRARRATPSCHRLCRRPSRPVACAQSPPAEPPTGRAASTACLVPRSISRARAAPLERRSRRWRRASLDGGAALMQRPKRRGATLAPAIGCARALRLDHAVKGHTLRCRT
eukprot:6194545-Pleurochrysis_carterae.AAC.8